jgi:hypothetical protein
MVEPTAHEVKTTKKGKKSSIDRESGQYLYVKQLQDWTESQDWQKIMRFCGASKLSQSPDNLLRT